MQVSSTRDDCLLQDGICAQRVQEIAGGTVAHGVGAVDAHAAALGRLDHSLMRRAMVMSRNDAFLIVLIVNVVPLPAVLLVRLKSADSPSKTGLCSKAVRICCFSLRQRG